MCVLYGSITMVTTLYMDSSYAAHIVFCMKSGFNHCGNHTVYMDCSDIIILVKKCSELTYISLR